jgi:hypothetical protein
MSQAADPSQHSSTAARISAVDLGPERDQLPKVVFLQRRHWPPALANQNHKAAGGAMDASLKVGDVSRGLAQSSFHGFELRPDLALVHALEAAPCLYRK